MNNGIFGKRLIYVLILVALTASYIFGRTLVWNDWISGFAYGLALSGLMSTFEKRPRK